MNLKNLCLFSQNVCKNRLLTEIILKNKKRAWYPFHSKTTIVFHLKYSKFIQQGLWQNNWHPNYPVYITFSRQLPNNNECPRVIIHINARLIQLCFILRWDILNYRDINLIAFFLTMALFSLIINIYSGKH